MLSTKRTIIASVKHDCRVKGMKRTPSSESHQDLFFISGKLFAVMIKRRKYIDQATLSGLVTNEGL